MSAEKSPMTRDSIELSLCNCLENLIGSTRICQRPAAASALGFRPASGVSQGD